MKKIFTDWAKEKYGGSSSSASAVLIKLRDLTREQKLSSSEPEFIKVLKSKGGTDSDVATLRSMFEIYKKESK